MNCPLGRCFFWDGFECTLSPVVIEGNYDCPNDQPIRENFTAYIRDDGSCGVPHNSLMVERPSTRETPVRSR